MDRGRRLVGADRTAAAAVAGTVAGAAAGVGPALSPRHPVRSPQRHSVATPAPGAGVRLRPDLLASPGPVAEGRGLRPAAPTPARGAERGRRTRLVTRVRGRLPHPREKGGPDTGPSPVDRRKTGSKHHLICDGRGTPLKVITTAANVNDVTQTLALVDGIPPVAGRPGRPAAARRPARRQGLRLQPEPGRATQATDPACHLAQGLPEHQRDGQVPLRRRADLRAPPSLQTSRRPLGTPHRTPRRLRLPGLQPDLLETPQEDTHMIVLRALRRGLRRVCRRCDRPPRPQRPSLPFFFRLAARSFISRMTAWIRRLRDGYNRLVEINPGASREPG